MRFDIIVFATFMISSVCFRKIKHGGVTKIYPLPHMYVVKDLIVDFNQFIEQHNRIKPFLMTRGDTIANKQYVQSMKDRDKLVST